jgi:AcrR family transcriptional regulator
MKVKTHVRVSSHTESAREPSRRRGELRVAVLLDAAAAAFVEKGYQAATMTEIARRARSSIGSLYQFFPSKEALAGALLARYGEEIEVGFRTLVDRASSMTPRHLADALVDLRLQQRADRSPALLLTEVRGRAGDRASLREAIRQQIARALREVHPDLDVKNATAAAIVILQALKGLPALAEEDPDGKLGLIAELRAAIERYVAGMASRPRNRGARHTEHP